jgi:hypothetical protein
MLQHKENCDLLYAKTLENHLKYTCYNTNNVNENMVLGLFYSVYQLLCYVKLVRRYGDYNW